MARLTVEEADRLAQERPPYPPPGGVPAERCPGPTGWHRPQVEDWNRGNRESTCTWCQVPIGRNFANPVWRTAAETADTARLIAEQDARWRALRNWAGEFRGTPLGQVATRLLAEYDTSANLSGGEGPEYYSGIAFALNAIMDEAL